MRRVTGALLEGASWKLLLAAGTLLVLVAILAPFLLTDAARTVDAGAALFPPSTTHLLGTDEAGADVLARLLVAARLEVTIAAGSVAVALLIGAPAGLIAGYARGLPDTVLHGFANGLLSFPVVLFAILMVASFGSSSVTLALVLAFLFVPRFFLVVRAGAIELCSGPLVESAKAIGATDARILAVHVLPNLLGALYVLIPQLMAVAILAEAGLSFIGLGVQPPSITWGTLLLTSKNYYSVAPWYSIAPGLAVTLVAGGLLVAGDVAGRLSDPRLRT